MNNTMKEKFDQLRRSYEDRRSYFKEIIEGFTSWGTKKIRLKGLALVEEADQLVHAIAIDIAQTAEGSAAASTVKKKLRRLKKIYNELHEMTKPWWRQWVEAIGVALVLAFVVRSFLFGLYHVPTGSAEKNILVGDRIWGNKLAYYYSDVKRGDLVIFDNPLFEYDRTSSINYYWQKYVGFPIPILGLGMGPDNWVKRVIAVPGDTIEGRVEEGKTTVYLNGKKLQEPYVNTYPLIYVRKEKGLVPFSQFGPFVVPSFLKKEEVQRPLKYTFDRSKSLEDQPFYKLRPDEVKLHPLTGEPVFDEPFTPSSLDGQRSADVFGPHVVPAGKYWVMGDSRKNSIDSRWWMFLDESLIHGRAVFVILSIDSEEPFWLFELIKHPLEFWTRSVRWDRFFKGLNGYKVE